MDRKEWITAFAREVGVQAPSDSEIEELLALASVAAHSSERPAAPLACWVAGRSGRPASELLTVAEQINPPS